MITLEVNKSTSAKLSLTNCVYMHVADFKSVYPKPEEDPKTSNSNYCMINGYIWSARPDASVTRGQICFGKLQRRVARVSLGESVTVQKYDPRTTSDRISFLATVELEADFLGAATRDTTPFIYSEVQERIKSGFANQCFTVGQRFVSDVQGCTIQFHVTRLERAEGLTKDSESQSSVMLRGILMQATDVFVKRAQGSTIRIEGEATGGAGGGMGGGSGGQLFKHDWNFESMGIGGLDREFTAIFRRAFAPRIFPVRQLAKMGHDPVKGMLLYGPPGTGKTLIARKIADMLNGKPPKLVSGPEIFDKYVGKSEENVRNLFSDAEQEYRERGDDSDLHIIIFDEMDAICKVRGSSRSGTGVGDNVVNQLLSKIDGVDKLNNILIIGMTNRLDLIDPAIIRPNRIEVLVEIGLPDEAGRLQIMKIHTAKMRENGFLNANVNLEELARKTKNFTGAEIQGLVRSAQTFALQQNVDANDLSKASLDQFEVTMTDFDCAFGEVSPAFGSNDRDFDGCIGAHGIIEYDDNFNALMNKAMRLVDQVKSNPNTHVMSILLDGDVGCGKTALSAHIAKKADFPFVKRISAKGLLTLHESGKCDKINAVFQDAYKSRLSCIVIDDIERILEYVDLGPRFSNTVLQTLLVLIKAKPPQNRDLLVIGTTSRYKVLKQMGFGQVFDARLTIPNVPGSTATSNVLMGYGLLSKLDADAVSKQILDPIPMRKLEMLVEMARSGGAEGARARFLSCLEDAYSMSQF